MSKHMDIVERLWGPAALLTIEQGTELLHDARVEIERLRTGYLAIKKATIDGRVCDDVAWFDEITTLHDFCDQMLGDDEQTGEK